MTTRYTCLAGGVGAARFLRGLLRIVPADEITVVVNTADDEEFHGLPVSPDLDTVTYTLAGAENPDKGWGLADDTFATNAALARYGMPTWFGLGDRDIATHLFRAHCLRSGMSLAEATAAIATAWDVRTTLLPMTNDRVRTRITVDGNTVGSNTVSSDTLDSTVGNANGGAPVEMAMQEWFVGHRCEPTVRAVRFDGADNASPAPGVLDAIDRAASIVVCPSNPVISIGPILAVPGVREALIRRRNHVVGVSPIIGGSPVKGPADRLMEPLGIEVSCVGVAAEYAPFCGTLVIDGVDEGDAERVSALGVRPVVADTMMRDATVAAELARTTLATVA